MLKNLETYLSLVNTHTSGRESNRSSIICM